MTEMTAPEPQTIGAMRTSMFGATIDTAAKAHALAQFPSESCGVVRSAWPAGATAEPASSGPQFEYIPLENQARDAEGKDLSGDAFKLPASALTDHAPVVAVIHSHCFPKHGPSPSAPDMAAQIEAALPFGIIWTDGKAAGDPIWWGDFLLDVPLYDGKGNHVPRRFLHGVNDCYSLVRTYFWQTRKIKLPDFARDDQWWTAGGDLYQQGFAKAGFSVLAKGPNSPQGIVPGDCVLMKWSTHPVPFHAGVILESGLLLHHPAAVGRQANKSLSRREPLGRWTRCVTHWLRHESTGEKKS